MRILEQRGLDGLGIGSVGHLDDDCLTLKRRRDRPQGLLGDLSLADAAVLVVHGAQVHARLGAQAQRLPGQGLVADAHLAIAHLGDGRVGDARVVGFSGDHDRRGLCLVLRIGSLTGSVGGRARGGRQGAGGGVLGDGGGDAVGGRDGGLLVVGDRPICGHGHEVEGAGVVHGVGERGAHGGGADDDGDDEGHADDDSGAGRGGAAGVAHRVLAGHGGQGAGERRAERAGEGGQQHGGDEQRAEEGQK